MIEEKQYSVNQWVLFEQDEMLFDEKILEISMTGKYFRTKRRWNHINSIVDSWPLKRLIKNVSPLMSLLTVTPLMSLLEITFFDKRKFIF